MTERYRRDVVLGVGHVRAIGPVLAALLVTTSARADAIGIPDCPPGGTGVSNPFHGTGWCTPAPCETDADCPPVQPMYGEPTGPRVCRALGVCVWGDRGDAIGSCEVEGAACTAPDYPADGPVCRVRRYCVEASRAPAPVPTTSVAPVPQATVAAATPTSEAPRAREHGGLCDAPHASARSHALVLAALVALVASARRRKKH